MARCDVCFRHCEIEENRLGFCGARTCKNGAVVADNYGHISSLALDPIEKKPLRRFHPGANILSVGSYGCNLRCPFCQNYSISWSEHAMNYKGKTKYFSPDDLVQAALSCRDLGNIGLAFTYNEPLIGYEYVRDTAIMAHDAGLVAVLVTNGTAELSVLKEILPHIDAMNIDCKSFPPAFYETLCKGNLNMVKAFIETAAAHCHVELTTLIIPGENDSEEEIREITNWIASLNNGNGREIPYHISRFFPRFRVTDRRATDVSLIYQLTGIARESLKYVYTGNC